MYNKISTRPGGAGLRARVEHVSDLEGKIVRALEALAPVAGGSVVLIGEEGRLERDLLALGSSVRRVGLDGFRTLGEGDSDVVVAAFTGFEGPAGDDDLVQAERVGRSGGRLLVLHDYARDDAAKLLHSPEARTDRVAWSRSDGWFITHGFKLRVIHCWWSWETIEAARTELESLFGADGSAIADGMRRPRLEHKVAIYHRSLGIG